MQMKERFMTIIEKRFYSIRMKCQRRIWNSIVLGSIFGSILQRNVIKDLEIKKEDSIMCIEMCSKRLRLRS